MVKQTRDKMFPSINLSWADIEGGIIDDMSFDTSKLTDEDMQTIASKIGEPCMETWWEALKYECEEVYKLKRKDHD